MKKGFTLIELLAVIVILAVIAVIAVPIVLNIINDTKESAILRSADFYLDGVETSIATSILKGISISDGTYSIMQDGNLCIGTLSNNTCTGDILKVEMDGEVPDSGTIKVISGQISDISLNLSDKIITKNNKGELVLGDIFKVCSPINDVAPAGISPGDKYQCKVKDNMEEGFKDGYYFYVLSQEEDGTTNLIMDRNINSDGTPVTKGIAESDKDDNGGIYNLVDWISNSTYGCGSDYCARSDKGPIEAMTYLNNATSSWSNIENLNITYDDEGGHFTNFSVTGKARMPYHSEVKDVGCVDDEYLSCPVWMIDYLYEYDPEDYEITYQENPIEGVDGYWTFSSVSGESDFSVAVDFNGEVGKGNFFSENGYGVRPVINVKL